MMTVLWVIAGLLGVIVVLLVVALLVLGSPDFIIRPLQETIGDQLTRLQGAVEHTGRVTESELQKLGDQIVAAGEHERRGNDEQLRKIADVLEDMRRGLASAEDTRGKIVSYLSDIHWQVLIISRAQQAG